jgi:hypothetical protein
MTQSRMSSKKAQPGVQPDGPAFGGPAGQLGRVCRAWHRASQVKVLAPGVRAAEGEEKGKGATARWGLKEAQSKDAGRRTGTGYEVWYTRDERARDREVLHARGGVLYKSGVYASQAQCLTPGDLHGVQVEGMDEIAWHRRETRRQQRKHTSS